MVAAFSWTASDINSPRRLSTTPHRRTGPGCNDTLLGCVDYISVPTWTFWNTHTARSAVAFFRLFLSPHSKSIALCTDTGSPLDQRRLSPESSRPYGLPWTNCRLYPARGKDLLAMQYLHFLVDVGRCLVFWCADTCVAGGHLPPRAASKSPLLEDRVGTLKSLKSPVTPSSTHPCWLLS